METDDNCMTTRCAIKRKRANTLEDCYQIINGKGAARYNRGALRRLFLDKIFLEKFFSLFDEDEDSLLKQNEWLEFVRGRLLNETHKNFIKEFENVVYIMCGDDPVNFMKFQEIFSTKDIVDKLFRLIDEDNTGYVSSSQIIEFITSITNTRPRAGFDKSSLEWLERIFKQTVGNEKEIRREEFNKIVTSRNPFFTDRVFQIFDKDNSGTISLQEFLDAMDQFAGKSPEVKIKFLFKVYDIDGDGLIQLCELEHVMRACMEENGMEFSEGQIKELAIALFEDADQANQGTISFEALKSQLEKHEGLLENLSISIDRWLVPPKPKSKKKSLWGFLTSLCPYQLTLPYMKNNYIYIIFLAVYFSINITLFVSRLYKYRSYSSYVMLARACGQCLNFNCSFVLVLMLRQCITFLRTHGFSSVLPLDQHIYLHKMTGVVISVFSVMHTLMHFFNFGLIVVNDGLLNPNNYTISQWLFTSQPGIFGLIEGYANPTGIILVILLSVMTICSMPFVRRGGCFEVFYWSHLLYVPFWILLIVHGPNFWKWFIGPGTIYVIERSRRIAWSRSQLGKMYISSGLLLPSRVTHLIIKRPLHFDFHPGDYVFVNIPVIARYEWHPFTISSAPEQEDYIWLHIRAVGEWSNSLYSYFEKQQIKLRGGNLVSVEGRRNLDTSRRILTSKRQDVALKVSSASPKLKDPCGFDNHAFVPDSVKVIQSAHCANEGVDSRAVAKEQNLHRLLLRNKITLEKSVSVPDMQTKKRNSSKSIWCHDYARSESERNFNKYQILHDIKSLDQLYSSPQNKELAQSFRYMRTKPPIIAFKTPSLEHNEIDTEIQNDEHSTSECGSPSTNLAAIQVTGEESLSHKNFEDTFKGSTDVIKYDVATHFSMNCTVGRPLEIFLDGPYGAPSSHIFRAQHAVLIATGIGVTPFASILQSIMRRYWKARHTCPKCKFSWISEIPPTIMHLRKVDFFWINRDQRSFEWFVNLLSQLEMEQAEVGFAIERFLEMHMYITSALQKNDMKAVSLQLAMDLVHQTEKRDLITGLKTRTNVGRPNWDKVFKQLQDKKKGRVTVFYCGPPQLAKILRYKCDQFGFSFRKESF